MSDLRTSGSHLRRWRGYGGQVGVLGMLMAAVLSAAGDDHVWSTRRANRIQQSVRALLKQRVDVNVTGRRRLDGAAVGRALERSRNGGSADSRRRRRQRGERPPRSRRCRWRARTPTPRSSSVCSTPARSPNTPIATGETPIMTCAGTGSADAVRLLIARGADVNAKEPVTASDGADVGGGRTSSRTS